MKEYFIKIKLLIGIVLMTFVLIPLLSLEALFTQLVKGAYWVIYQWCGEEAELDKNLPR